MIELHGLCKYYGKLKAVDSLSLRVGRGEVLGFIGPNGAGKTTTLRMLATLLPPDAGTAAIHGLDILKDRDEVRGCLGYMPDFFGVYDQMRVWEYLDFFACAHRVPYHERAGLIGDVLELVDLGAKREAYVETLSRGMKQRLCLAMTLVHDPQVLLLDEPASGLDPRARIEMRLLLQELCRMDKTIIISSHILTELAELCTKVAIIEQGKLMMIGSVEEINQRMEGGRRRLVVGMPDQQAELCAFLGDCEYVRQTEVVEANVRFIYEGDAEAQRKLLAQLVTRGFPIQTFSEEEADLEDLYMRIVRDSEEGGV